MGFRTDISRAALCAGFAVIGLSCERPAAEDGAGGAVQATAAALVEVDSCVELQAIASDLAGDYRLTADVDCTGFDAGDSLGFLPLGEDGDAFTGTFDGDGHLITNLTIARPWQYGVGLFGVVEGAVIERVGLVDASVEGYYAVGVLVGAARASMVRQSFATGSVAGAIDVGGLVGGQYTSGAVSDSYAAVAIDGEADYGLLVTTSRV